MKEKNESVYKKIPNCNRPRKKAAKEREKIDRKAESVQ